MGKEYDAIEEIHSQHAKYIINGKSYNSVCFEVVRDSTMVNKNQALDINAQTAYYRGYNDGCRETLEKFMPLIASTTKKPQSVIKEGRVVKGGVNKPPQNPRPRSTFAPTKQPQNKRA